VYETFGHLSSSSVYVSSFTGDVPIVPQLVDRSDVHHSAKIYHMRDSRMSRSVVQFTKWRNIFRTECPYESRINMRPRRSACRLHGDHRQRGSTVQHHPLDRPLDRTSARPDDVYWPFNGQQLSLTDCVTKNRTIAGTVLAEPAPSRPYRQRVISFSVSVRE